MNAVGKPPRRILLRLFVAGATASSERAKASLNAICADLRLHGPATEVQLETIDVLTDPDSALLDQVFATPTVIRVSPGPARRLFGDLSSPEMVSIGLQLTPEAVPT
jgi:circadian clock protein KaiB